MSDSLTLRVIMSFGSFEKTRKRLAAVYYSCIAKLVEKYTEETDLIIDCNIVSQFTGELNDPLLEEIAKADVIIALLDENITVTYELAFRHILRGQMILFLLDKAKKPLYLENWAHNEFSDAMITKIKSQAKDEENFPNLQLGDKVLSQALLMIINGNDDATYKNFKEALKATIKSEIKPSIFIKEIVCPQCSLELPTSPKDFKLSRWGYSLFYPLSIIKIKWKGIHDIKNGIYEEKDMESPAIIFDANRQFIDLYQLNALPGKSDSQVIERLNRQKSLTLDVMLEILHALIDDQKMDWEKFMEDQFKLTKFVVFQDPIAARKPFNNPISHPLAKQEDKYAKVPITMSQKHPKMPGRSLLPCLFSRESEGDFPKGKHTTYLLVAYIDITGLSGAPVLL